MSLIIATFVVVTIFIVCKTWIAEAYFFAERRISCAGERQTSEVSLPKYR